MNLRTRNILVGIDQLFYVVITLTRVCPKKYRNHMLGGLI